MKIRYFLNHIFFESKTYLIYTLLQLILLNLLIVYILIDFTNNIKKQEVIICELIIAVMMIFDMVLYLYLRNGQVNFLIVVEWSVVGMYLLVFFMIWIKEFEKEDEYFEFVLLVIRFSLQLFRFILALFRFKETRNERRTTTDINFSLSNKDETSNEMTNNNNISSSKQIIK